jgi:hypothetical protein
VSYLISFAMGRVPLGGGSWEPRFPVAHLLDPTLGIVPGKQQAMEIADVLQDEVICRLKLVEPEKQCTEEDCRVFHHAWLGPRGWDRRGADAPTCYTQRTR